MAGVAQNGSATDLVVWRRVGSTYHRVLTKPGAIGSPLISCTSTGVCGVVEANHINQHFFSTGNSGASWSTATLPSTTKDPAAVGCAVHTCVVLSSQGGVGHLLAASTVNGGGTWSVSTAYPKVNLNGLAPSISCASALVCLSDGFVNGGIVDRRGGSLGHWTPSNAATGPSLLDAVGCATATKCVAVGGTDVVLTSNNGTTWTHSSQGFANGTNLVGVACPSAGSCIAVGADGAHGVTFRSIAAGADWHPVTTPSGVTPLSEVACAGSSFCVATGPNLTGVLLSTNEGVSWTLKSFPAGWGGPSISSVSCVPGQCMAVGADSGGTALDVVLTSGGSIWTLHTFTTFTYPTSVSCETTSACWSVGTYFNTGPGGIIPGVYGSTNGGATWTLLSQPPTGQPGILACASSICHDVGTGSFRFPIVDQLATSGDSGSTWTGDTTPAAENRISGLVLNAGRWIGVGETGLRGPEVITSP